MASFAFYIDSSFLGFFILPANSPFSTASCSLFNWGDIGWKRSKLAPSFSMNVMLTCFVTSLRWKFRWQPHASQSKSTTCPVSDDGDILLGANSPQPSTTLIPSWGAWLRLHSLYLTLSVFVLLAMISKGGLKGFCSKKLLAMTKEKTMGVRVCVEAKGRGDWLIYSRKLVPTSSSLLVAWLRHKTTVMIKR